MNSNTTSSGVLLSSFCSERGSITVMTTLLIILACFTAVILADVGQLMFEKSRLQNAADAAALSAATVQSVGLNEMADLNYEIKDQYTKLVNILLKGFPWNSIAEGTNAIKFFEHEFSYLRKQQDRYNKIFAEKAQDIGEYTVELNLPSNRIWDYEVESSQPLMSFSNSEKMPVFFMWIVYSRYASDWSTTTWSDSYAQPKERADAHDGRMRTGTKSGYPIPYFKMVKTWRSKVGKTTEVEVNISQAPADFISSYKIVGQLPRLTAHAKAKPTGGHVGHFNPQYRAMLTE